MVPVASDVSKTMDSTVVETLSEPVPVAEEVMVSVMELEIVDVTVCVPVVVWASTVAPSAARIGRT